MPRSSEGTFPTYPPQPLFLFSYQLSWVICSLSTPSLDSTLAVPPQTSLAWSAIFNGFLGCLSLKAELSLLFSFSYPVLLPVTLDLNGTKVPDCPHCQDPKAQTSTVSPPSHTQSVTSVLLLTFAPIPHAYLLLVISAASSSPVSIQDLLSST